MKPIKQLAIALTPFMVTALVAGGVITSYAASAKLQDTAAQAGFMQGMGTRPERAPAVRGVITAINGSSVTITAEGDKTGTYTIDTSSATFMKSGAAASLSSFKVGDTLCAIGTITGTNVVATKVVDAPIGGMGEMGGRGHGRPGMGGKGPGVMGSVTAVNGSTITLTGKDGKTYTIDAAGATVQKVVTTSLSDIVVGDSIGVQGTVSGTTVTAKNIMDDVPAQPVQ